MNKFEHDRLYEKVARNYGPLCEKQTVCSCNNVKDEKFFNRIGNEISKEDWCMLRNCREYTIIKHDLVEEYSILTTWSGINVSKNSDDNFIFVTEISRNGDDKELIFYDEESLAIKWHRMFDFFADQNLLKKFLENFNGYKFRNK